MMESTEELLGSLTTFNGLQSGESVGQTVRTSARVFKKMRQDSSQVNPLPTDVVDKKDAKVDGIEKLEQGVGVPLLHDTNGIPNKSSTSAAKQRMPKAPWSLSEKNLFFEALNEYGKDFDSITAYICNKVKKKGVPDNMTKNKHQVSHFYYRTWQKVSKYVKFGEDVKKVVQELYTLINYGEMRKRLVSSVVLRTIPRLSELVCNGVVAVRAGGRTIRVRTPVCRALRKLNRLEEWEEQLRLPSRIAVLLCPRDMETWSRVHAAAHNPRMLLPSVPSRRLSPILTLLQRRWLSPTDSVRESLLACNENKFIDNFNLLETQISSVLNPSNMTVTISNKVTLPLPILNGNNNVNTEQTLDIKVSSKHSASKTEDNVPMDDNNPHKTNSKNTNSIEIEIATNEDNHDVLHKGNVANNDVNKIDGVDPTKNDIDDEKKDLDQYESTEKNNKWYIQIDSKKFTLHVGPKPGTELNIPTANVSEHLTSQRISYAAYQERSENVLPGSILTSSNAKVTGRFKSHKRQRKDSGENDPNANKKTKSTSECWDKNEHFNVFDVDETANDGMNGGTFADASGNSLSREIMSDEKSNDDNFQDKDLFPEQEDETDGESDAAVNKLPKETSENVKKISKTAALKSKVKIKKERDTLCRDNLTENIEDPGKPSNSSLSMFFKKTWNRDILMQQVKKGWSFYDSGDLTIGDLYLMFGNDSKLELNYWWEKPTPPFDIEAIQNMKKGLETDKDHEVVNNQDEVKVLEKRKTIDQEKFLLSPNHSNSVESIEIEESKKDTEISPDAKCQSVIAEDDLNIDSFNIASKIINNPTTSENNLAVGSAINGDGALISNSLVVGNRDRLVTIASRLKKLLTLSQLYINKSKISCGCGHVCGSVKGKKNVVVNTVEVSTTFLADSSGKFQNKSNLIQHHDVPNGKPKDSSPGEFPKRKMEELPRLCAYAYPQDGGKNTVDFSNLPRWRRTRKPTKKPVVVRQLLPIAPWPQPERRLSTTVVAVPPLLQPPLMTRLPQLRPAPPRKWYMEAEKPTNVKPHETIQKNIARNKANTDSDPAVEMNAKIDITPIVSKVTYNIWPNKNEAVKDIITDGSSNLSNILDISLPSNIGDENPLGECTDKLAKNEKHEDFVGLLHSESMSMPSLSPSRLLKESDDNWLGSDVHDFSLSSFLGHLENAPSMKPEDESAPSKKSTGDISSKKESMDMNQSSHGTDTVVENQLHCLMSETSIDYMAKFADLAAQVDEESKK